MGIHVLENECLKVMVADAGAELSSVFDKETQTERLFDADPAIWNRHAPILFPFVGKVAGGKYHIGDHTYEMKTQHGFARDMEFACVEETADSVTHRLVPTDKTRALYPYEFELLVTHALDAENPRILHVNWEVKNNGDSLMYYSIGGHPAFTVPVQSKEERDEYYLEFPGKDELVYVGVNPVNGLALAEEKKTLELDHGFIQFYDDVYDTLIFDYQEIQQVRIARPDKTPYITMECSQFPFLGIWAKENGNFICLEPWAGRTDNDGFAGTLEEKTGEKKLEAGRSAILSHWIEFHK